MIAIPLVGLAGLVCILVWLILRDRRNERPQEPASFGDLAKLWRDEGGEG